MAKNIMIQGTMSNVGKSLICTGLCRIFRQDGYRVAPFKSQNMALNSYITKDGGEMGMAQAVQAEAAGLEPDVRMNPILIKATSSSGCQVIVGGRVRESMNGMEYLKQKQKLASEIMDAYSSLAAENDIIVIEGAGSPAEINLNSDDIVNMGLAEMVDAPVLIVGDIDRGGIFAQLYGTVALLRENERSRVKGTVINKFIGDRESFGDGIEMLEELCGVPVAGLVDYIDVDISDEDSLTDRFRKTEGRGALDIAVIRFPHISNFTDFDPFELYGNVSLRYVSHAGELDDPDIIFLPGTKSTVADLMWFRQNGMEEAVLKKAEKGTLIFGVCGGLQMLTERISDPDGVEASGVREIPGMGLLDGETVFEGEKLQIRTEGVIEGTGGMLSVLNGKEYCGYEIHMGRTSGEMSVIRSRDNVYGSYVHGLFDRREIREAVLKAVCERKGIGCELEETSDMKEYRERQYDLLADGVRRCMDMELVYRILNREE